MVRANGIMYKVVEHAVLLYGSESLVVTVEMVSPQSGPAELINDGLKGGGRRVVLPPLWWLMRWKPQGYGQ